MVRCTAVVLLALFVAAPVMSAEEPAPTIRASIDRLKADPAPAYRPIAVASYARARRMDYGVVVTGLAVAGLYGGMFLGDLATRHCHCDDRESAVARFGLGGAIAGAALGVWLTWR